MAQITQFDCIVKYINENITQPSSWKKMSLLSGENALNITIIVFSWKIPSKIYVA